jgi:uncharacterized protein
VTRAMKVLADVKQIVAADFPGGRLLRLAPRIEGALAGIESVNPWWDRSGTHEFDLVGTGHNGLPVAAGSVKWRENQPFNDRDLAKLAAVRSVVPHSERASLLAVSPRGIAPGVNVDMVLDAADLLGAWQA